MCWLPCQVSAVVYHHWRYCNEMRPLFHLCVSVFAENCKPASTSAVHHRPTECRSLSFCYSPLCSLSTSYLKLSLSTHVLTSLTVTPSHPVRACPSPDATASFCLCSLPFGTFCPTPYVCTPLYVTPLLLSLLPTLGSMNGCCGNYILQWSSRTLEGVMVTVLVLTENNAPSSLSLSSLPLSPSNSTPIQLQSIILIYSQSIPHNSLCPSLLTLRCLISRFVLVHHLQPTHLLHVRLCSSLKETIQFCIVLSMGTWCRDKAVK